MVDEFNKIISERYRRVLRQTVATVTFTKKDGTDRVMHCTLHPNFLPQPYLDKTMNAEPNYDNITVWDLEAKGWRSFRTDSVKEFDYDSDEGTDLGEVQAS